MSAKTAQLVLAWFIEHVYDLLLRAKRDPQQIEDVLQVIKDDADFHRRFFPKKADDDLPRFTIDDWVSLYLDAFRDHVATLFEKNLTYVQLRERLRVEIGGVKLSKRVGFDWLLVVLRGLTPEKVFAVLAKRSPAWKLRSA